MSLDVARAVFATSEYRKTVRQQDLVLRERDPLATELEFVTLLESEEDAVALCQEILSLLTRSRGDWSLLVPKGFLTAEIGDTLTISYPRFGLAQGRNFILKRRKISQSGLFDELTLFGPQ